MGLRIYISIIISFMEQDIMYKGVLVTIGLVAYLYILMKSNPYKNSYLNRIEKISAFINFLSVYFAFLSSDEQNNSNFFVVLIFIINIIFVGFLFK